MRIALAVLSLGIAATAQAQAPAKDYAVPDDEIFHYSVMEAMRNGVYRGAVTVGQLKRVGDFGIGTYNDLDGELVGLDGVFYRVAPDGKVAPAGADRKIPFGAFAFFKSDANAVLKTSGGFEDLQRDTLNVLPSRNHLFAVRLSGTFDEVVAGGANKLAENDRTPIANLMKTRPQYSARNVKGTVVGFYNPPFVGGVDLSPFHLHFISEDRSFGGHIISMRLSGADLHLSLDAKTGMDVELPHEREYFNPPWTTSGGTQKSY